MKIVITDSGLGGLSVAAALYERLKCENFGKIEIIFANALPESGKGYNKMPDKATKIKVFNRALEGFYSYWKPDMISVACNTLSVLLKFTQFNRQHSNMISDVVSAGIDGFLNADQISNDENLVIFGTETTIESGVHADKFFDVFGNQICAVPCSGLAGAIEKDFQGKETKEIIRDAVARIDCKSTTAKTYVYLACTHYGYVKDLFSNAMQEQGFENIQIIDPNVFLIDKLFTTLRSKSIVTDGFTPQINVVSRCKILDSEIESISHLVRSVSQDTAMALQNYQIVENLFYGNWKTL